MLALARATLHPDAYTQGIEAWKYSLDVIASTGIHIPVIGLWETEVRFLLFAIWIVSLTRICAGSRYCRLRPLVRGAHAVQSPEPWRLGGARARRQLDAQ